MCKTKKYRHSNQKREKKVPFICRKGVGMCAWERKQKSKICVCGVFKVLLPAISGYVSAILCIDRWPKQTVSWHTAMRLCKPLPMLHILNSITQHNNTIANCRCRCCIKHLLLCISVEYARSTSEALKLPWSPRIQKEDESEISLKNTNTTRRRKKTMNKRKRNFEPFQPKLNYPAKLEIIEIYE